MPRSAKNRLRVSGGRSTACRRPTWSSTSFTSSSTRARPSMSCGGRNSSGPATTTTAVQHGGFGAHAHPCPRAWRESGPGRDRCGRQSGIAPPRAAAARLAEGDLRLLRRAGRRRWPPPRNARHTPRIQEGIASAASSKSSAAASAARRCSAYRCSSSGGRRPTPATLRRRITCTRRAALLLLVRELWKDLFVSSNGFNTCDNRPPNPSASKNDVGIVWSIGWSYSRGALATLARREARDSFHGKRSTRPVVNSACHTTPAWNATRHERQARRRRR
jgi:hypothetical protein